MSGAEDKGIAVATHQLQQPKIENAQRYYATSRNIRAVDKKQSSQPFNEVINISLENIQNLDIGYRIEEPKYTRNHCMQVQTLPRLSTRQDIAEKIKEKSGSELSINKYDNDLTIAHCFPEVVGIGSLQNLKAVGPLNSTPAAYCSRNKDCADVKALRYVNVKLMKQYYQDQQQHLSTKKSADSNKFGRLANLELPVQHWESTVITKSNSRCAITNKSSTNTTTFFDQHAAKFSSCDKIDTKSKIKAAEGHLQNKYASNENGSQLLFECTGVAQLVHEQDRPHLTDCQHHRKGNTSSPQSGIRSSSAKCFDKSHNFGNLKQKHEDETNSSGRSNGNSVETIIDADDLVEVSLKLGQIRCRDNVGAMSIPLTMPTGTIQQQLNSGSSSTMEVAHLSAMNIPLTMPTNTTQQQQNSGRSSRDRFAIESTAETQKKHLQMHSQSQQNQFAQQPFQTMQRKIFQTKPTLYRQDCDLSGSYASLECPSPPGPPVFMPESQRDPQARLSNFLKTVYQELCFKELVVPSWSIPVPPGLICPARLEPDLRLNSNSHGSSDSLNVDQILVSLQSKDGNFLDAPRRCLIECPSWASRSNLCLRILHAWTKEPPWPPKGTPVALTLLIPLYELKRGFAQYVQKELLPKCNLNPFAHGGAGFTAAWNSLESLGPKLLIILDGYCSPRCGNLTNDFAAPKTGRFRDNKHFYPSDVYDLLDGRLFPEARVIITTYTPQCNDLMPIVQRHITYEGLTWGRSASILDGGQWSGSSRLLDLIQANSHLRRAIRTPLGCLAIATIYHTSNGSLPVEEMDVIESIFHCVAPTATPIITSEIGRLALFCLKMKKSIISSSEIKMYCAEPNNVLGCLEKNMLYGKSAEKKGEYVFNPICAGMMEFLAANYIASLSTRPGLLAAEITGMAIGDELDPDLLKVLKFSMALLGDQAHILLSRLTPLWLTPQIIFTLTLAGGHSASNLAALCDILGISKHPPISPLETRPLWVQVRSAPTDLMGWGMALRSSTCTLRNLEVTYQLEKHDLVESRKAMDIFLDSIIHNESVSTLRLSSLIESDVKDCDINYLANCVSKLILKPKLDSFELVLTLIEEDPPMLKLQPVIIALCRTIPHQSKLSSLLIDIGLSTSQLIQLCGALEKCPNITRLSLPHLKCERGAVSALSSLLSTKSITLLSLPSCWGARDDPPSSSGVSMGSGSGSSTGTSCFIKQGSLPVVPSPRSYAPGIFSSLPRGVFVPQSSLSRSATLPRQPLEQATEKRSCDSVISKSWYPTPACEGTPHNSGTLHDLFFAIRDPHSKVHNLDLSKAQLSLEDAMCLGETIRLSSMLHTLKLEGATRMSEILPSILGASESSCLQMLNIGSHRLSVDDPIMVMSARALTNCTTLRLLNLDGWYFRIENSQTFTIIQAFLSLTSVRELSLSNCRLQTSLVSATKKTMHTNLFESRSVVVLKLAGAQITLPNAVVLRGPQLLQYISGFTYLRELDLSATARSGIETTHSSPLILNDKSIIKFFQDLYSYFGFLNTLKICHWVIHLDEFSKTLKSVTKAVRGSSISHLKLDGISVLDRPKKVRNEAAFTHCFLTSLPQLRWMGISLSGKKENQIAAIGTSVLDLKGAEIEIKLSESTIEQAKLMAQAISANGKFDTKVSTFGTSSGILIHAEKSGLKSLTRKSKKKDQ